MKSKEYYIYTQKSSSFSGSLVTADISEPNMLTTLQKKQRSPLQYPQTTHHTHSPIYKLKQSLS